MQRLAATGTALQRLQAAWERSDLLFSLLRDEAWRVQPIPLRQPFLFYLGHLPAFAWNHLCRGVLGEQPFQPEFDALFERGIDPVGVDRYEPVGSWPARALVVEYRDRIRDRLADCLAAPPGRHGAELDEVLAMVVEHELMHHETLLYMVQELDHGLKRRPARWPALPPAGQPAPLAPIEVPAGEAVLGAEPGSVPFGWDNEFPVHRLRVPAFEVDSRPVTNEEWLAFQGDGGYGDARLWRPEDWTWRTRARLVQPHSWRGGDSQDEEHGVPPRIRSLLADVPFETAAAWPVQVSWAEANAYASWRGARLPSEPEWQRAAYGSPADDDPARSSSDRTGVASASRRWPWGDAPPSLSRANVAFQLASPVAAGSCASGASAWGVLDLVGNGWEWTGSPFERFPGFQPLPRYPGYSADFFDGRHFVLLGGSWATDAALLRRSFRNWFQPHYPFVFSQLRCARSRLVGR